MQWLYLSCLLFSIAGLMIADWRYKLAFWHDAKRAGITIGAAVAIFIVWDALGIALKIFYKGASAYALPFTIAPHLPVEEIFFLILLTYTALILYRGLAVWRRI